MCVCAVRFMRELRKTREVCAARKATLGTAADDIKGYQLYIKILFSDYTIFI